MIANVTGRSKVWVTLHEYMRITRALCAYTSAGVARPTDRHRGDNYGLHSRLLYSCVQLPPAHFRLTDNICDTCESFAPPLLFRSAMIILLTIMSRDSIRKFRSTDGDVYWNTQIKCAGRCNSFFDFQCNFSIARRVTWIYCTSIARLYEQWRE